MVSALDQEKIKAKFLKGTLEDSLSNKVTAALNPGDDKVMKFHGTYQQDDRDRREEREDKFLEKDYSFMIRLRIAGGVVTPQQWMGMQTLCDKNASGVIKITTRQTIQLHGVLKHHLKPTMKEFDKYGLDAIAACGDVNRNVTMSSFSNNANIYHECLAHARKISDDLLPKSRSYCEIFLDGEKLQKESKDEGGFDIEPLYGKTYLPRKFKIAIAIPPFNDVDIWANDIGLIAVEENGELIGYNVLIGGGMGRTHGNENTYARTGSMIGFITKDRVVDVCWEIAAVQRDWGNREKRDQARLKYTVDRVGVDVYKAEVEKRLGQPLGEPRDYHFKSREDLFGWSLGTDGKHQYTYFVENGRVVDTDSCKHRSFLDELAALEVGYFAMTCNQNISIAGIEESDKAAVEAVIAKYSIDEYMVNSSSLRKNSIACVALNTCPLALAEAQRYMPTLLGKIEDQILAKYGLSQDEIFIRMTGCPNGCARPYIAEVALVGKAMGKYDLHLGGSRIGDRVNKIYKESLNESQILAELDSLMGEYSSIKSTTSFGDFSLKFVS